MAKSDAASWEAFLAGVGAKDKLNIEKHLTAIDGEGGPGHGRLWRQIAIALRKLAPSPVQTVGQHVVQFFIPDGKDGKYRMQVFCLEDQRDGRLMLYLPDVLADAFKAGVLAKPVAARAVAGASRVASGGGSSTGNGSSRPGSGTTTTEPKPYPIKASKNESLEVEMLDSTNTPDPPAHVKHMLGWNRKALRITLPALAAPQQAAAAESLCELAAKTWAAKLKV